MENRLQNTPLNDLGKKPFKLIGIDTANSIELKNHTVLFPPTPCCAQLAAPYWTKIIGTVVNKSEEELLIEVVVTLYDEKKDIIKECSDALFLDASGTGEFDINIPHLNPVPIMYSIKIDIKEGW